MIPPRCTDPARLFVGIDVMWWAMAAFSIVCKATDDPVVKAPEMRPILCGWLAKLLGSPAPGYVAAFLDSKGPTWRHLETRHLETSLQYKAGRTKRPPEFWSEVEDFRAILRLHRIPCLGVEGWEADDIAATVTRLVLAAGLDVALVTFDHDWQALTRDRDELGGEVYCWSYGRKDAATTGPAEMLASKSHGLAPRFMPEMIALCGDADNITGASGVGPDKARVALRFFGSVPGILAAAKGDLAALSAEVERLTKARDKTKRAAKKGALDDADADLAGADAAIEDAKTRRDAEKYRGMIAAHRERVELGLTLATLDPFAPLDPPFDLEACAVGGFDVPALVALYTRLGFSLMARDVASTSTENAT